MAFGGADLSTMDPNPSMDDYASTSPGTDWSTILNTAGQWGATIASVVSGNRVAVVPTQGGGYQTIGVAGSGMASNQTSQLLLIAIAVIVVVVLVRK
jgi:hypothetical protein